MSDSQPTDPSKFVKILPRANNRNRAKRHWNALPGDRSINVALPGPVTINLFSDRDRPDFRRIVSSKSARDRKMYCKSSESFGLPSVWTFAARTAISNWTLSLYSYVFVSVSVAPNHFDLLTQIQIPFPFGAITNCIWPQWIISFIRLPIASIFILFSWRLLTPPPPSTVAHVAPNLFECVYAYRWRERGFRIA